MIFATIRQWTKNFAETAAQFCAAQLSKPREGRHICRTDGKKIFKLR
jgi:hypothetical protein